MRSPSFRIRKLPTSIQAFAALDKADRKILYASASIPANLVMFLSKVGLLFVAPSLLILANALFTLGVAVAKVLAIREHRTSRRKLTIAEGEVAESRQRRVYRTIGWILVSLSLMYLCGRLLGFAIGETHQHYERWVAVTILVIALTEIGFSLAGAVWARRNGELVIEAIRLANLAGALALVALAQTAILSLTNSGDASTHIIVGGIVFGALPGFIGVVMVTRPLVTVSLTVESAQP